MFPDGETQEGPRENAEKCSLLPGPLKEGHRAWIEQSETWSDA